VIHLGLWELKSKAKSAALSVIRDTLDLTVKLANNLFANVQPKAYSLCIYFSGGIKEPKLHEEFLLIFNLYAYTVIFNWDLDHLIFKWANNCNLSSILSKF